LLNFRVFFINISYIITVVTVIALNDRPCFGKYLLPNVSINQILFILQPCGWIKWQWHTS